MSSNTLIALQESLNRYITTVPEKNVTRIYRVCLDGIHYVPVLVLGRVHCGPLTNPTKWIVVLDYGGQIFALKAADIDIQKLVL